MEEERRLQVTQHAESLRLMQRQVETLTGPVELVPTADTIQYRPGRGNGNADTLSRRP